MSEKNQEGDSTSSENYDIISAQIEGAVDMVLSQETENGGETGDQPTGGNAGADTGTTVLTPAGEEQPSETPTEFSASDADIERAVKAGLSVADAKSFKDKATFDRVCAALEGKAAPKGDTATGGKPGEPGKESPEENAGEFEIPTLPDDEGFDPKLVDAFGKMGNLLKQVLKENAELKKAGTTAEAKTFFDQQLGGMDNAAKEKLKAKFEKFKAKFDMLEAAYKATGANMTREEIFGEAVQLTLGADIGAAGRASKLAARKSLHLAPPSGEGKGGTAKKTEDDVDRDIARLLSEKFNI